MSNYIQISIEVKEEDQDILISKLSDLEATGFEQTHTHLIAYFDEENFKRYDVDDLLKNHSFNVNTIKEQNWNEVWESNFEPVMVDDFCFIRADFHEPDSDVEHEIIITPKMSFGTGHHATTYMMVQQMKDIHFTNKTVFDFGTGTGILAILAEKLGAKEIDAIDVDDWSIENAKENFERNGCLKINIDLSSNIPAKTYDIILANINRNVILQYLPQLKNALANDGYLLLSGLLSTDQDDITKACNELGFELVRNKDKTNWISLLFVKRC